MTIITLLLILNPAALALIWLSLQRPIAGRDLFVAAARVAAYSISVLALGVLFTAPLLDALNTSDSTFRIAAGALVILGAGQAFLGFGLRHPLVTKNWLIVAGTIWLVSPPAIAAAAAIRVEESIAVGLGMVVASVAITIVLSAIWVTRMGERYPIVLGFVRRVIAAGALYGGVDLVRQGVLSI